MYAHLGYVFQFKIFNDKSVALGTEEEKKKKKKKKPE